MKYSCKTITVFIIRGLLSHVGSLLLIVVYLLGGGWMFIFLEAANEISACNTSMNIFYQKLNETAIRAVTISKAGYNDTYLGNQVISMLSEFAKNTYSLSVSPDMNCSSIGTPENMPAWNLANAIFFCATLITTIGYGNISPVTQWGRVVCIIYSFIGIPLMLIFLSNFGVVLANAFRCVYSNLCCCRCFLKKQREPEVVILECSGKQELNLSDLGPPKMIAEQEQDPEVEDNVPITIPIIVITGFISIYMLIGAALFQIWEPWDNIAGVYFSFITISTIGLGDLYPTKDRTMTSDATVELLVAAAYCLIGLAFLSMSLSLMQEEISGKLQWLSYKIGLYNHEEEIEDQFREDQYFEDGGKPMIIKQPIAMVTEHHNNAYDEEEEEEDEYEDVYDVDSIYPKLHST